MVARVDPAWPSETTGVPPIPDMTLTPWVRASPVKWRMVPEIDEHARARSERLAHEERRAPVGEIRGVHEAIGEAMQ